MNALDEFKTIYPEDGNDGGFPPHRTRYGSGVTEKQKNEYTPLGTNLKEAASSTAQKLYTMSQADDARGAIMRGVGTGIQGVGTAYNWINEPMKYAAEEGEISPEATLGHLLIAGEKLTKMGGRGAEMWATGADTKLGQLPRHKSGQPWVDPDVARTAGEIATGALLDIGAGKGIQQLGKLTKGLKIADNLTPSPVAVTVDGMKINPTGVVDEVQPLTHLKSMDNVSPSYWHRDFPKTGSLEEKIEFFNTPISKSLKSKNVKGGKITAKQLAKNESLTNELIKRADGIIDKYIKGDQRKLYDFASHNIFNDAEAVYGTGLVKKIQQVFLVTQGKEWHHIFGNKEAGEFLLNHIAQDPVLTANLFKHMNRLNLKTGAIAENMALMRVPEHKAWHKFMQQLGTESRVKMQASDTIPNLDARGLLSQNKKRHPYSRIDVEDRPVRMGTIDDARTLEVIDEQPWKYTAPLDVADYGHSIAEAIKKGETDVNELFTFLTVYHEKYLPWMKEQLKNPKFAAEYLTDLPEGPEKAVLLGLYKKTKRK